MTEPRTPRIVITGATGFLGERLTRHFAARGMHVTVLVRDVARAQAELPEAAGIHAWSSSMTDGPWTAALDGADAVINLAGAPVAQRWTQKRKAVMLSSRVDATRNLVAAMGRAQRPPLALVNASGVGFYGTSATEVFNEQSPAGRDYLARICSAWEAEAWKAAELGTRVCAVRIGIVMDPAEGALARMLPSFRLFAGGPVASGRQWFPWIHIDDLIELFGWACSGAAVSGPVNAAAPGIVTNEEFSTALGRVLHRPSYFRKPEWMIRLILGEGAYILCEGQNVIPERTLALGFRFRFAELEPALAHLLA